jgi:hypothetical protein
VQVINALHCDLVLLGQLSLALSAYESWPRNTSDLSNCLLEMRIEKHGMLKTVLT